MNEREEIRQERGEKGRREGGRRRKEGGRSRCIASKNKNPTLRMWGKTIWFLCMMIEIPMNSHSFDEELVAFLRYLLIRKICRIAKQSYDEFDHPEPHSQAPDLSSST